MKPAGYWPCRNEIINAHLSTPHKYEPFTELFDTEKLDEIRDHYGADLYKECYADALHEVMELSNIVTHLRALGVDCKPIFTPDDCSFCSSASPFKYSTVVPSSRAKILSASSDIVPCPAFAVEI